MDFHVGSARAAMEDIGNQASDIHVYGGKYGIITKRTAPVWQFLLMDSSFEGQSEAAIHTMEAGFTLIRVRFAHMPIALQIAPGEVEQLYGRDLQMEDIRAAAIKAGNVQNPHSEVTLTNVACSDVPTFYQGDETVAAPSQHYMVDRFTLGLEIGEDGRERGIAMRHQEHTLSQPAPSPVERYSGVAAHEPMGECADPGRERRRENRRHCGVAGGDREASGAVFPSGTYRVSSSIELKPDTVLIGLNPGNTSISLANGAPGFEGEGRPHRRAGCAKGRQEHRHLDQRFAGRGQSARSGRGLDGGDRIDAGRCVLSRGRLWGEVQPIRRVPICGSKTAVAAIFRGNWPHGTSSRRRASHREHLYAGQGVSDVGRTPHARGIAIPQRAELGVLRAADRRGKSGRSTRRLPWRYRTAGISCLQTRICTAFPAPRCRRPMASWCAIPTTSDLRT